MKRFYALLVLLLSSLVLAGGCGSRPGLPHFTVTADPHGGLNDFRHVLRGIDRKAGGIGGFHVTCGDIGSPEGIREVIDGRYGADALWFPVVGNHDAESGEAMEWLRSEFNDGHQSRHPLRDAVTRTGPAGASETVYSWDYADAHFVVLNVYWNGRTDVGSDTATGGHVVPELLEWLRADLAENTKPFIFIFGHEPAFVPNDMRHYGDSLDAQTEDRDAFWRLLAENGVTAYISGHVHYRYSIEVDGVWQLCAGKPISRRSGEGRTFLNVVLSPTEAVIEIWADRKANGWWAAIERIQIPARQKVGAP